MAVAVSRSARAVRTLCQPHSRPAPIGPSGREQGLDWERVSAPAASGYRASSKGHTPKLENL